MMKRSYASAESQEKVLKVIKSHIMKPCPTNAEIAEELGTNRSFVSRALSELCARNILSRDGRYRMRAYTIVETGEKTEFSAPYQSEHSGYEIYPFPTMKAAEFPQDLCFDDIRPDDLDACGRAYLAFDASPVWPTGWPKRPVARKSL